MREMREREKEKKQRWKAQCLPISFAYFVWFHFVAICFTVNS